jgi:hypothetical protein
MKKIFYFLLIIPFLLTINSCESELDRLWLNPNKYTPKPEEVVSGLFTRMQKSRFWEKGYGENYYLIGSFGTFLDVAQIKTTWPYTESYINRWANNSYGDLDKFVSNASGNISGRFTWFYTDLTNYSLIRYEIDKTEGSDYDESVIYFRLATILKNIVALQTVDLFNSIPYFDSFRGIDGIFYVPYDDPKEIYRSVISEYKEIAAELPGIYSKMSETSKMTLKTQDLFFKGDIDKWVQFINAECLRACVRISGVDGDFVKPFISDAIKNLPKEDFTFTCPDLNQCRIGSSGNGGIMQRGMYEQFFNMSIPDVIMTRMNRGDDSYEIETDDPRLPVIAMGFTPDGTTDRVEYFGISMNWERNKYLRLVLPSGGGRKWIVTPQNAPAYYVTSPAYSMDIMVKCFPWTYYNPVTYVLSEMPLCIVTRSEVDLFLAEVALKGLASTGKTPGDHINDAVKNSISFWYMMNSAPNYAGAMSDATKAIITPTKPSESIINNYANTIKNEFELASGEEGKMEILMQQKYIHLNFLGCHELFAELRRTRHPKLEPVSCKSESRTLVNETMMLERFMLPTSERATNFEEYSKVMETDKWSTPVFWVPQNKINEKYFLQEAIKPPLP